MNLSVLHRHSVQPTHRLTPRRNVGHLHRVILNDEERGVLLQELPQPGLGAARDLPHLLREPLRAELAAEVVQTPATSEMRAGQTLMRFGKDNLIKLSLT